MLSIVLALAARLSYGASDFLAGSQTRRTALSTVIVFSQAAAVSLMALVVLARGNALPEEVFLPALSAGLLSAVSVVAGYQPLAVGVMGITGPVCSPGAAVPVIEGLASGERPSAPKLAGIGIALGGALLASRKWSAGEHHEATSELSIILAVLSAVAFGFAMVFYAQGAQSDPYWSVVLARSTALNVFALAFIVMRPGLKFTRAAAVPILGVGARHRRRRAVLGGFDPGLPEHRLGVELALPRPPDHSRLRLLARTPFADAAAGARVRASRHGADRRRLTGPAPEASASRSIRGAGWPPSLHAQLAVQCHAGARPAGHSASTRWRSRRSL